MTTVWSLQRGANVVDTGVRFSVWAPHASEVSVQLSRGDGSFESRPLESHGGVFEGTVLGAAAGTDYSYRLDGGRDRPDPVSRFQPVGLNGPSRVMDPGVFKWTDHEWKGLALADMIIYELHIGTFSKAGTFTGVIQHLHELRKLGVTAIELMPVAQFPGARNWGYDGVLPYAVQNTYGGPDGLRMLVDAAHGEGLGVVLDVVYNHIGPEGNHLGEFGPYFTERYKTPWGAAMNFDGRESDEVRRYFVDNALHWLAEYHIDSLRLDAADNLLDVSPRHILEELSSAVHIEGTALGRRMTLVAEADANDPRYVRPAAAGGYGLDAQWVDDFHHAARVTLVGETTSYFSDYRGVASVAKSLRDRYVYDGQFSPYRRRKRGRSAEDIAADHFVVCVQNHDQVGNRATGDRLSAVVSFEQEKLAAALLLLSPYVPLIFMGQEYGETNPFQYFVSHDDRDLCELVRAGRRKEFEAFGWGDEIPDPESEETFVRSRLDRSKVSEPRHAAIHTLYRDLIQLRKSEGALRPGAPAVRVEHDESEGWIALTLTPKSGRELLAVYNFSRAESHMPAPVTDRGSVWMSVLSTTDRKYGGDGMCFRKAPGSGHIILSPHSAELYSQEQAS
ncbi:MAG: malto-oligosyltrehalose trehalohydrolase [Anaerolineae bacterium]|nr:malto-oligosyltrehalose trehalohydrolase [Gemmatimonadaceae bacterium]